MKYAKTEWPSVMPPAAKGCRSVSRSKVVELMQAILDHYHWPTGTVMIGYQKSAVAEGLCDLTGQSSATVRSGLAWLEEQRYVKRIKGHGFNGLAHQPATLTLNVELLLHLLELKTSVPKNFNSNEPVEGTISARAEDFRGGAEDFRGDHFLRGDIPEKTEREEESGVIGSNGSTPEDTATLARGFFEDDEGLGARVGAATETTHLAPQAVSGCSATPNERDEEDGSQLAGERLASEWTGLLSRMPREALMAYMSATVARPEPKTLLVSFRYPENFDRARAFRREIEPLVHDWLGRSAVIDLRLVPEGTIDGVRADLGDLGPDRRSAFSDTRAERSTVRMAEEDIPFEGAEEA